MTALTDVFWHTLRKFGWRKNPLSILWGYAGYLGGYIWEKIVSFPLIRRGYPADGQLVLPPGVDYLAETRIPLAYPSVELGYTHFLIVKFSLLDVKLDVNNRVST